MVLDSCNNIEEYTNLPIAVGDLIEGIQASAFQILTYVAGDFYHDIDTHKQLTETVYIFLDQKALKQDLNSVENACQLLQQIVHTENKA